MSTCNAALVFGLVLLQAALIKHTHGQTGTCQVLDLAFLIDGSGSICDNSPNYTYPNSSTCDNWEFIVDFVYDFVNSLNISPDGTRVAVATFADSAILLWNLAAYANNTDKTPLLKAINDTLKFPKGNTHTTEGLNLLINQVFNGSPGDRPGVSNTAIIITDGKPTNSATVNASVVAVHDAGIKTLVVGVTANVDIANLQMLSSDPKTENVTYFMANKFSTINQVKAQLFTETCQNQNVTVPTPSIGVVTPTTAIQPQTTACDQIDLCFIVDRSGSICDSDENFSYAGNETCNNWAIIVKFIRDFVSNLTIGPSNYSVAMVTFDNSAKLIWGLGNYTDKASLLNAIDRLRYMKGGTTDTTGGLNIARTQVFKTPYDRPDARNVAIIITDGKPTEPSTVDDAVKALQGDGCLTLAVGITDSINEETLKKLSSPQNEAGKMYFMAANYAAINMIRISLQDLTCPQSTTTQAPLVDPCPNVQDVVIVLDGSGSICDSDPLFNFTRDTTCNNWNSIRQFLHNLTTRFVISPAATRVALIQFSIDARLVWGLDTYADKDTLLYAIDNLQYTKGGSTNMTGALNVLNSQVFTPQLMRSNAAKTAIIVTDGKPTVPSTVPDAVKAVNDSGIRRLVVGVTNQTDNHTLKMLASDPWNETYFIATDYKTIDAEVTKQLSAQACRTTSTTSSTTIPTAPTPTSPSTSGTTITICTAKLDLAFVVDGSGSICNNENVTSCGNWNNTLKFIHDVAQHFTIGLNETRVGMIVFASTAQVLWNLTAYTNSNTLLDAISNMKYVQYGTTDTTGGLNLLTTSMFNWPDDRPDVNNTAIIITDGKPTVYSTAMQAIQAVHNAKIKTIVVGITNDVDNSTLAQLSSDPQKLGENYFMATDFETVDDQVTAQLVAQACQGTIITPSPTSPSTSGTTITICTAKLDLAFVVDRSGSICGDENVTSCGNWNDTLKFIHGIVDSLSIGLDQTRVGMIIFSSPGVDTKILWNLTTYTNSSALLNAIDNMPYLSQRETDTTGGLNLLRTLMSNESGDRPDVNNTAIIITDGYPTDNTTVKAAVDAVHNATIRTLVVGITNLIDENMLKGLSSSPYKKNETYFMAPDFNSLYKVQNDLRNQTCGG